MLPLSGSRWTIYFLKKSLIISFNTKISLVKMTRLCFLAAAIRLGFNCENDLLCFGFVKCVLKIY